LGQLKKETVMSSSDAEASLRRSFAQWLLPVTMLAVVCGALAGPPSASALPASQAVPTFADVPVTHPYYAEIEALYQAGYTAGCSTNPLMYCPEATMNRGESAVFVERGIHSAAYEPPTPTSQVFADLPLDSWAAAWVSGLWQDQYTAGCGTNPLVYCPWQGHTRAEGAVFYMRMLNGPSFEPPQPVQQMFTDVPLDAWYARWAHAAYQAGLIPACQTSPGLRFCPQDPLTRGLAAYMMVQAKDLIPSGPKQGNVYIMTGDSRDATSATINGVPLRTDTIDAINQSIGAMLPTKTDILDTSPSGSYSVDVNVNAAATRPIHPLFFGANLSDMAFGWTTEEFDRTLRDPRYAELLGKLRPGLLRFPGGSIGDIHWDRSNTRSPIGQILRAKDLDYLVTMSRQTGATLFIQVPLYPESLDEWTDFAAYVVEKNYTDVVYISSGNENEGFEGWDAATYVSNFKLYYNAMKAIKPDLVFGAPEACDMGGPSPFDKPWVDPILQQLSSQGYQVGLVTSHLYQGGREITSVDDLLRDTSRYTSATQLMVQSRDRYYPNVPAMWTEWGPTWGNPARHVFTSVGTALWGAEAIGRVARAGGDGVSFYRLSSMKDFPWPSMMFTNDLSEIYPMTLTYLMFAQWWGSDWVTNVSTTNFSKLSVNASIDSERVYVMLVNKTTGEALSTRVTVNGGSKTYYFTQQVPAHSITLVSFER
jgi:hypothetical protein